MLSSTLIVDLNKNKHKNESSQFILLDFSHFFFSLNHQYQEYVSFSGASMKSELAKHVKETWFWCFC